MSERFPKIGHLKDVQAFRARMCELAIDLPCDDAVLSAAKGSPLAQPLDVGGFVIGNRWCAHAMEGWDGTRDGSPTEHTLRRWRNFGASGCKWIWGGEAFAVQGDGRANPNQLGIVDGDIERARRGLRDLLQSLHAAHRESGQQTDDLLVGLQLTHSGRFCKPNDKFRFEPKIAYHHPLLDGRVGVAADDAIISDDYLRRLIDQFVIAAKLAQDVGFQFVDVKHCHGYLGHELLSGFTRPGEFGGSFENRTRFAREVITGIRAECPGLMIGVRLSAFDTPPFPGTNFPRPYRYAFGCDPQDPFEMDLTEPIAFINMLADLGVRMINASAGSPYYNPHLQRPAIFPPSDGYPPPEDPLLGVARQIGAVRRLKEACPRSIFVGTGYTYLQEFLPHVAQAVIRESWGDAVGIGRLMLSYWDLPADTLAGRPMQNKRICRTFSDCTTAPRNGIISGCYPLDPYYKTSPEHVQLKTVKSKRPAAD
jgi:2,4-dienoyl-CoA reductase-like NADH-dependent reductase (Old Yellow Enzyme family)